MTSCKYIKWSMIIGLALLFSPVSGMEPILDEEPVRIRMNERDEREVVTEGWGSKAVTIAGSPFVMINDNREWFNLVGTLMQAPSIFTIDSTDPKMIKFCASLAAVSTGLKILSIASSNGQFMKMLMVDVPKVLCYLLSISYDGIRILDAPKVVLKNSTDAKKLKFFKFIQLLQLSIEIVLRGMAIMSKNMEPKTELVAWFATELADVISIWRLLERYKTYFISEIDMVEFTFGWKKAPASDTIEADDHLEIEKIEELAALAEAFAEKKNETQNIPETEESPMVEEGA